MDLEGEGVVGSGLEFWFLFWFYLIFFIRFVPFPGKHSGSAPVYNVPSVTDYFCLHGCAFSLQANALRLRPLGNEGFFIDTRTRCLKAHLKDPQLSLQICQAFGKVNIASVITTQVCRDPDSKPISTACEANAITFVPRSHGGGQDRSLLTLMKLKQATFLFEFEPCIIGPHW